MATPTPVFPIAVATDAQLKVANNLVQTTLTVAVDAVNTILFVTSTAGFKPNSLISVDKEIIAIASVSASPNPQLIVAAGGRGFDGTSAAAHSTGAKISMFIDAWHHNALSSEIQAIEAALGPNLNNVSKPIDILTTNYTFPAQSPGGSLIVGSNVITLAPVPKGVNGTNTNHWLYISGGTGTAEPVQITGGTAVAGAPSGTVIVTCAHTHTGAWTVSSATAGAQEAYYSTGTPGNMLIRFPSGPSSIYAPITVKASGVVFAGSGMNATGVYQNTANVNIFDLIGPQQGCGITGMTISQGATSTAGVNVHILKQSYFVMRDIFMIGGYQGLYFDGGTYNYFSNVLIVNMTAESFLFTGADENVVTVHACTASSSTANGFHVISAGQISFTNCSALGGSYGLIVDPATTAVTSLDFVNCYFDSVSNDCVLIAPNGGGVSRIRFSQCWMSSGHDVGVSLVGTASSSLTDIKLTGCLICSNTNNGVNIGAYVSNVSLIDCSILNNGSSTGISVASGADGVKICNCFIGNDPEWGPGTQANGIFLNTPVSRLVIAGNIFKANTASPIAPAINAAALAQTVISDNAGVSDVMQTLASAGTLGLSFNPIVALTGTTAITTINGGWAGRQVTFVNTGVGSITVGGGGNVPGTHTLAANMSLILTYTGSGWF